MDRAFGYPISPFNPFTQLARIVRNINDDTIQYNTCRGGPDEQFWGGGGEW